MAAQGLSTGIFEAVSGRAVLGNSHDLVANAGLSGVTCALYPLQRSLMLAPLVLTLRYISVPTVGHLQSGVQHCPWSAGTLSLRRWPETILPRGLPLPAEAGSQALLSSALLFSLSLPASALHLPHFPHIDPVLRHKTHPYPIPSNQPLSSLGILPSSESEGPGLPSKPPLPIYPSLT